MSWEDQSEEQCNSGISYMMERESNMEKQLNFDFFQDIEKFNEMYGLYHSDVPIIVWTRMAKFMNIIGDEMKEGMEILKYIDGVQSCPGLDLEKEGLDTLVKISDWLGDLIVYCTSEARRYGIPIEDVLKIIMESNFSKLGADGKPIIDERGYVVKGPGYYRPETKLRELLIKKMNKPNSTQLPLNFCESTV